MDTTDTLASILSNLSLSGWEYAQQSRKPDWYAALEENKPAAVILACATMGSSPHNEWYAFRDRAALVNQANTFTSQTFIDRFVYVEAADDYFYASDVTWTDELDDSSTPHLIPGAQPAHAQDMISAESPF